MSREQTTPMEVAAEALGASMGYAGAVLKKHEKYTHEQAAAAAQTMATAAQAAATLELAAQQRIQNLIALSAAGGNLGVSPAIQQAALQVAAAELIDLDAAMAGQEPEPVEHYRTGAGQCNCGFDAYTLSGIMIDYGMELEAHLRANR